MEITDAITLTEEARNQINSILADNPTKFVRVAVVSGGCSGFNYSLDLIDNDVFNDDDLRLEDTKVIIDGLSYLYLVGTTIDYKKDLIGSMFVFENPSAASQCGCGTSFSPKF